MGLSAVDLAVCLAAVAAGAAVQGAAGFGVNLVAVPIVAIVAPPAVPGTLILTSLPLSVGLVVREHHALDRRGATWMVLGILPGTAAGTAVVATLSTDSLGAVIGAVIVGGAVLSATRGAFRVTDRSAFTAGVVSGLTGTAAAVGGPPLALLYQHHPGPTVRATLNAVFVVSTVLSIVALAAVGEMTVDQTVLAIELMPALVVGMVGSRGLARRVDAGRVRPVVIAVSGLAGLAALVHALVR
ncbi:MAG: TSUP family transporter [Acidimicrobiia bacterium]|nr:TSUP family transporter [Acidimicrobiia bacterium]